MGSLIFDIISVAAVLIPTALILVFFPINMYLKQNTKKTIKNTNDDNSIEFFRRSPKILKIWLHKDAEKKWALFSRFFFSYNKAGSKIHGQAVFRNKKLIDIKYYPPEYQDPNGKFPILSANDEVADAEKQKVTNILLFPEKD